MTRPLLRPNQRFDLEDYNTGLSALRADSHFYTQRFLSDKAYILQGFTIDSSFIGQPTADVSLSAATLINGNNTGDVSWWTAPASPTPLTLPTGAGGLQGGRNYVELQVYSQDGTPLQRAFWDPNANSGDGLEFPQEVNTVTEMLVKVVINQTGFSSGNPNLIKLAYIDLDGSLNIRGIKDKRDLFYRLGEPDDIDASYVWGTQAEPGTTLIFGTPAGTAFQVGEILSFGSGATATVLTGGTNNLQVFDFSTDSFAPGDTVTGTTSGASATLQSFYESFTGADKDIQNMRDMFAALMNEIRRVKGTRFWYELGNTASLPTLLNLMNSFIVPISTGARFSWSGTALKLTDNATSDQATSDVIGAVRRAGFAGDLFLTREDGTGGSAPISIADGSVLFIELPAAGASRTYSESGPGANNFQVTDLASFVPTDNHYILAYREGSKLIVRGNGELSSGEDIDIGEGITKETLAFIGAASDTSSAPPYTTTPSAELSNQFSSADSLTQSSSINAANINDIVDALLHPYQERLVVVAGTAANSNEVHGPVTPGSVINIPLDSRNSSATKKYRVGLGSLMIFLNGQELIGSQDYLEFGTIGHYSNNIQMIDALVVGDVLDIRMLTPQFFGTSGLDQPFYVNYLIGQNGTSIPVGSLYNMGTDRLQIWRNGVAMIKSASVGDIVDRYLESTANSIVAQQAANNTDVFVMVNHAAPNPNVTLLTGLTGTVLTVPTYTTGDGSLLVFRNGVLLSTSSSADASLKYTESSTTTITLALAALSSDVFKIYRSSATPTWRQAITGITGTTVTTTSAYVLASQRLLVFRNGLMMVNSSVLGQTVDRYHEATTHTITLESAAITADLFECIYI